MAATVPHEVYAQQLVKYGWGYPLWEPEPEEPWDEILIGDVGYFERGGFCRLFNAIEDSDGHIQTRKYPPGIERFDPGPDPSSSVRRKTNAVSEGPHASATVRRVEIGAGVGSQGLNIALGWECTDRQGALVILDIPGVRELSQQVAKMRTYMKVHIDAWCQWATGILGLDIDIEDIVFVRGYLKTSRWAVVSLHGDMKRATLTFKGHSPGMPVAAAFHLDIQQGTSGMCEHRIGPDYRPKLDLNKHLGSQSPGDHVIQAQGLDVRSKKKKGKGRVDGVSQQIKREEQYPADQYPADQCMFLHYFKLKKRRLLPSKIEAAAEPQDPSMDRDAEDAMEVIEEIPARVTPYDPVVFILDYILENSKAEVAIASDLDLICLCERRPDSEYPIPDDIPRFLEQKQPLIEIKDGLGTLLFDEDTEMHLGRPTSEEKEVAAISYDIDIPGDTKEPASSGASGNRRGALRASDPDPLIPPSIHGEDKWKHSPSVGSEIAAGIGNNMAQNGNTAQTYPDVYVPLDSPFGNTFSTTERPVSPVAVNTAAPAPAPTICFFGGPCPHPAPDALRQTPVPANAMKRHLEECHNLTQDRTGRFICEWGDADKPACGTDLKGLGALAKHIATVHLRSSQVRCKRCGMLFSRRDSERHKEDSRCSLR
ncbi:uncharacterized protein B0H18DRAFT_912562 [Fomitopsis serialis]|uniref:uncharacterized protein n=1 Tax=Fomitopsis serialis TaxID=139415 RepID=UPI002007ED4A|nr:uncharacterized protein B0H18DRAFT_912562 [Neoantrodia serialis]KAH9919048.1 hypothetical protein B0H18DRAFT_912562 [Neoantrodia serialis]